MSPTASQIDEFLEEIGNIGLAGHRLSWLSVRI